MSKFAVVPWDLHLKTGEDFNHLKDNNNPPGIKTLMTKFKAEWFS